MLKRRKWLIRLLILLAIVGVAFWNSRGPSIDEGSYLVLDLRGAYVESRPAGQLARLVQRERVLVDLLDNIRKARHDGRIDGIVARIGQLQTGWAQTSEIRNELALVRAEGKSVTAIVELELNAANKEFYLASVADKVYVPRAGAPLLTGLAARYVFLGGLWPKIDIAMHVEQIREYKSAGDALSRESMSDAHREMANSILDSVNSHYLQTLAAARNLMVDELTGIIDRGPASAETLATAGLIDGTKSFESILEELATEGEPATTVDEALYASVSLGSLGLGGGPKIAVIHAAGTILAGSSSASPGTVGARELTAALRSAGQDESVKAVVVRVASPGGSPAGSDEIWQELRKVADEKPLVVSMGDVAASGGYYIASGAERILASPATLTGSIGVVFYKPNVSALMDRIGVHSETIARGNYARLMDLTKNFEDDELLLIQDRMESIYDLFLERVALTRESLDREAVDRVGGGRVWTGQQALDLGLVDELGGYRDALRAAATAAGIHDVNKATIAYFPEQNLIEEQLSVLKSRSAARSTSEAIAEIAPSWMTPLLPSFGQYADLGPGAHALMPFHVTMD